LTLQGQKLAQKIADLALEKKAIDIKVLDLRDISDVTDFFVICHGESDVQNRAISNHIEFDLKKKDRVRSWHTEGYKVAQWILIDYVDVVVHIFSPDNRSYYGLEDLWGDAPTTTVIDKSELE